MAVSSARDWLYEFLLKDFSVGFQKRGMRTTALFKKSGTSHKSKATTIYRHCSVSAIVAMQVQSCAVSIHGFPLKILVCAC
jgi:hypothetical protein